MVVGTGCVDRRAAVKLDSGVRTSAVSEGPKIGAATAVAARERLSTTHRLGRSGVPGGNLSDPPMCYTGRERGRHG